MEKFDKFFLAGKPLGTGNDGFAVEHLGSVGDLQTGEQAPLSHLGRYRLQRPGDIGHVVRMAIDIEISPADPEFKLRFRLGKPRQRLDLVGQYPERSEREGGQSLINDNRPAAGEVEHCEGHRGQGDQTAVNGPYLEIAAGEASLPSSRPGAHPYLITGVDRVEKLQVHAGEHPGEPLGHQVAYRHPEKPGVVTRRFLQVAEEGRRPRQTVDVNLVRADRKRLLERAHGDRGLPPPGPLRRRECFRCAA